MAVSVPSMRLLRVVTTMLYSLTLLIIARVQAEGAFFIVITDSFELLQCPRGNEVLLYDDVGNEFSLCLSSHISKLYVPL